MPTRILFLAAQIQPYLISGIKALWEIEPDFEILIYASSSSQNDWIMLPSDPRCTVCLFVHKPEASFFKRAQLFSPQIVVCAGWMFSRYLKWSLFFKQSGACVVCAMDTQWQGTFRQRLLSYAAKICFPFLFTHAWVPGPRQRAYAQCLGFDDGQILPHLYAPDVRLFEAVGYHRLERYSQGVCPPQKLLYVGRLEPHKIEYLVRAFCAIQTMNAAQWHLTLVGDGSLTQSALLQNERIKVLPAQSQQELTAIALEHSVFCLCSNPEPWGTVAQEFAAAAMPLIISTQCGSSELMHSGNAIFCDGADLNSIQHALEQALQLSQPDLLRMSRESFTVGCSSTAHDWAMVLLSLV